jgi:hypothetical protein
MMPGLVKGNPIYGSPSYAMIWAAAGQLPHPHACHVMHGLEAFRMPCLDDDDDDDYAYPIQRSGVCIDQTQYKVPPLCNVRMVNFNPFTRAVAQHVLQNIVVHTCTKAPCP